MPTLTELTSDTARVEIVYSGVTVCADYAPSLMTEKSIGEMLRIAERQPAIAALPDASAGGDVDATLEAAQEGIGQLEAFTGTLNRLLARVVRWWDLTEDDGATMYPLIPDRLADLPLPFRQAALSAIFGDLRLGGTTASDTPRPSLATSVPSKRTTLKKRA